MHRPYTWRGQLEQMTVSISTVEAPALRTTQDPYQIVAPLSAPRLTRFRATCIIRAYEVHMSLRGTTC